MKKIILTLIFFISIISAQEKTNFEVIQSGLDSVVNNLISNIDENKSYILNIESADEYSVFASSIKNSFADKIKIVDEQNSDKLNFTINEIKLNYNDCFRDGLFGDFFTERVVTVNSSYNINKIEKALSGENIVTTLKDTVKLDEIQKLENSAYRFTKSEKPKEPFLSGLTEPIIAVSAIAVSIYLLFSVRSN